MMDKLLTKRQAGDVLQVSARTVDRIRAMGKLKAVKVRGSIRFRVADLENYILKGAK
jgi:excisionase family DNA binding protein